MKLNYIYIHINILTKCIILIIFFIDEIKLKFYFIFLFMLSLWTDNILNNNKKNSDLSCVSLNFFIFFIIYLVF